MWSVVLFVVVWAVSGGLLFWNRDWSLDTCLTPVYRIIACGPFIWSLALLYIALDEDEE